MKLELRCGNSWGAAQALHISGAQLQGMTVILFMELLYYVNTVSLLICISSFCCVTNYHQLSI